ncbi:MAG: hypothetical protein PHO12_02885 [Bacteroidales bacterium]|nr:hypothetical protein [Bacteroidales bacterium]MDD4684729.1 hypothetical protein [Bacteroidales bacterium]
MQPLKTLLLLIIVIIVSANISKAQSVKYAKEDFDFTLYLLGNNLKEEAKTLMTNPNTNYYNSKLTQDSINYLKGWTFYSSKELLNASLFFDSVSKESALYAKSTFFNSLSNAHTGNYSKANSILKTFADTNSNFKELYHYEKAGLALLERDYEKYKYHSQNFTYQDFRLIEQEEELNNIYNQLIKHKHKSPWVAGIASAIVPGLGKIYAGSYGEGVSSFLLIGSLGAITAENWVKHGPLNWKTLVFGAIGAVFYVGNIYGSVTSVKIYYEDFNNQQNITILYNIHIPLRTIFN